MRPPRRSHAICAPNSTGNDTAPPGARAADAAARDRRPRLAVPPPRDARRARTPRRVLTLRNYLWIVGARDRDRRSALRCLGPVLTPFLIGAILAYLGTPLVDCAAAARRVARAGRRSSSCCCSGSSIFALFLVLVPLVQARGDARRAALPELFDAGAWRASRRGSRSTSASTLALDLAALRDVRRRERRRARRTSRCSCCRASRPAA